MKVKELNEILTSQILRELEIVVVWSPSYAHYVDHYKYNKQKKSKRGSKCNFAGFIQASFLPE